MSVCRVAGDLDMATMTISDNGNGFKVSAEDKLHRARPRAAVGRTGSRTAVVDSDHGTVWMIRFPTAIAAAPGGSVISYTWNPRNPATRIMTTTTPII